MDRFLNPMALAVFLPLLLAVAIYILEQRSWRIRNGLAVASAGISFILLATYLGDVRSGAVIVLELPNVLPPLGLSFRLDYLSMLGGLVVTGVWFLVSVYATEYMIKEHAKKRFYPFLVLTLAGAVGVMLSADLFTFFLFFELMSLSAYVLVVHEESPEAMRAGYKYLIMTIIGGLALFFSIIAVYEMSGSVAFVPGGYLTQGGLLANLAFVGFLVGFGIKAGIVPFHVWLPEAHPVAPSPASALLSGVMLKTGVIGLIRVTHQVFTIDLVRNSNWNTVMLVFASVTIVLGSAVAITEDDIKRRLAYSSIGQMGYILLGIGLLQERAMVGAIFHIFAHAVMKSALFLTAGAVIYRKGKRSVKDWGGIGREMFPTMVVFTIAALSMIGIPPLIGFVSKWELSLGALDNRGYAFVGLLLLSSLMNFVYYFPIIQNAFFGNRKHGEKALNIEAAPAMLVPMIVLACFIVFTALVPGNFALDLARKAAAQLFLYK